MRKISSLLVVLFVAISCKVSDEPEFVKMENIFPTKVSVLNVEIVSDAIFNNPNDVGCELVSTDITVLVNGNEMGKASQAKNVEISSKGEFTIPLKVSFSPTKLLENKDDILSSSLPNLLSQKIEISYKGTITLKKAGVSFDVPVDKTDEISLKK